MEVLAAVALYLWLPIVVLWFREKKGHRAVAEAYVTAWLALPAKFSLRLAAIPDYDKEVATALGLALAVMLFEPQRVFRFRFSGWDIFMAITCFVPAVSSVYNGQGTWDAISLTNGMLFRFGFPYLLGRIYLGDFPQMSYLARMIVYGGLIYTPLCLIELRMSPQIKTWVYGLTNSMSQAQRYGGWRPVVFLDHGLELGMWMTASALMALTLWHSRQLKPLFKGWPSWLPLAILYLMALLCKSTGALLLLAMGSGAFLWMAQFRRPGIAVALMALPVLYISLRIANTYDGKSAVRFLASVFGEHRAQSLDFRLNNENMLTARAWQSPIWGWGGWGRNRVFDEFGEDISVVDGLWIHLFGVYGLVGMTSFFVAYLVPPMLICCRFVHRRWDWMQTAPTLGMALFLLLFGFDCCLNAMPNGIYALALGGITAMVGTSDRKMASGRYTSDGVGDTVALSDHPTTRHLWPRREPTGADVGESP